jgi:hypothetical protein
VTRCALLATLAGAVIIAPNACAQGKLRRAQQAIHSQPTIAFPELPSQNNDGSWFGIDPKYQAPAESSLGSSAAALGIIGIAVATSPFWGPHEIFDAGFDERGWFPAYPYVRDDRPYMVIGACPTGETVSDDYFDPCFVKPWALRIGIDIGDDFDHLSRFGGQLFLDSSIHRLGILANINYYRENLRGGRTDEAWMGDYNLTWRVTQSQRLIMHLGAGLRTWTFDGETDPGVNVLYRADVFPVSQLHLSGLVEVGNLRDAFVLHGQVQAGFTFGHGEVFAGYDFLRIGTVNLQGPSVGVRLWF